MKTTNRYLVATCGVLLHLMLGSTYAWSIYRNPIMAQTGWDQSSVSLPFIGYLSRLSAVHGTSS